MQYYKYLRDIKLSDTIIYCLGKDWLQSNCIVFRKSLNVLRQNTPW